jgi:haloalkane dehalogenase
MTNQPSFTEHRVPSAQGSIYVRDYAGAGTAFVLMARLS